MVHITIQKVFFRLVSYYSECMQTIMRLSCFEFLTYEDCFRSSVCRSRTSWRCSDSGSRCWRGLPTLKRRTGRCAKCCANDTRRRRAPVASPNSETYCSRNSLKPKRDSRFEHSDVINILRCEFITVSSVFTGVSRGHFRTRATSGRAGTDGVVTTARNHVEFESAEKSGRNARAPAENSAPEGGWLQSNGCPDSSE